MSQNMYILNVMCIYLPTESLINLILFVLFPLSLLHLLSSLFNLPPHVHLFTSCHFPVLQGLKARNFIHSKIEENIKKKVHESHKESKHRDALQQLIDSSRKNKEPISIQVAMWSLLTCSFKLHMKPEIPQMSPVFCSRCCGWELINVFVYNLASGH